MHTVQLAYTVRALRAVQLMATVGPVHTLPEGAEPVAPARPSPADRP